MTTARPATLVNGTLRLVRDQEGAVTDVTVDQGGLALPESLFENKCVTLLLQGQETQLVSCDYKLCNIPSKYTHLFYEAPGLETMCVVRVVLHGADRSSCYMQNEDEIWELLGTKNINETKLIDLWIGPGMVVHAVAAPGPRGLVEVNKYLRSIRPRKNTLRFCSHLAPGNPAPFLHIMEGGCYDMVLESVPHNVNYHWIVDGTHDVLSLSSQDPQHIESIQKLFGEQETSHLGISCQTYACKLVRKASLLLNSGKSGIDIISNPKLVEMSYILQFYVNSKESGLCNDVNKALKEALASAEKDDGHLYCEEMDYSVNVCPSISIQQRSRTNTLIQLKLRVCRGIATFEAYDSFQDLWLEEHVLVASFTSRDSGTWNGMVYEINGDTVNAIPTYMLRTSDDGTDPVAFKTKEEGLERMPFFMISSLLNTGHPVDLTVEYMSGPKMECLGTGRRGKFVQHGCGLVSHLGKVQYKREFTRGTPDSPPPFDDILDNKMLEFRQIVPLATMATSARDNRLQIIEKFWSDVPRTHPKAFDEEHPKTVTILACEPLWKQGSNWITNKYVHTSEIPFLENIDTPGLVPGMILQLDTIETIGGLADTFATLVWKDAPPTWFVQANKSGGSWCLVIQFQGSDVEIAVALAFETGNNKPQPLVAFRSRGQTEKFKRIRSDFSIADKPLSTLGFHLQECVVSAFQFRHKRFQNEKFFDDIQVSTLLRPQVQVEMKSCGAEVQHQHEFKEEHRDPPEESTSPRRTRTRHKKSHDTHSETWVLHDIGLASLYDYNLYSRGSNHRGNLVKECYKFLTGDEYKKMPDVHIVAVVLAYLMDLLPENILSRYDTYAEDFHARPGLYPWNPRLFVNPDMQTMDVDMRKDEIWIPAKPLENWSVEKRIEWAFLFLGGAAFYVNIIRTRDTGKILRKHHEILAHIHPILGLKGSSYKGTMRVWHGNDTTSTYKESVLMPAQMFQSLISKYIGPEKYAQLLSKVDVTNSPATSYTDLCTEKYDQLNHYIRALSHVYQRHMLGPVLKVSTALGAMIDELQSSQYLAIVMGSTSVGKSTIIGSILNSDQDTTVPDVQPPEDFPDDTAKFLNLLKQRGVSVEDFAQKVKAQGAYVHAQEEEYRPEAVRILFEGHLDDKLDANWQDSIKPWVRFLSGGNLGKTSTQTTTRIRNAPFRNYIRVHFKTYAQCASMAEKDPDGFGKYWEANKATIEDLLRDGRTLTVYLPGGWNSLVERNAQFEAIFDVIHGVSHPATNHDKATAGAMDVFVEQPALIDHIEVFIPILSVFSGYEDRVGSLDSNELLYMTNHGKGKIHLSIYNQKNKEIANVPQDGSGNKHILGIYNFAVGPNNKRLQHPPTILSEHRLDLHTTKTIQAVREDFGIPSMAIDYVAVTAMQKLLEEPNAIHVNHMKPLALTLKRSNIANAKERFHDLGCRALLDIIDPLVDIHKGMAEVNGAWKVRKMPTMPDRLKDALTDFPRDREFAKAILEWAFNGKITKFGTDRVLHSLLLKHVHESDYESVERKTKCRLHFSVVKLQNIFLKYTLHAQKIVPKFPEVLMKIDCDNGPWLALRRVLKVLGGNYQLKRENAFTDCLEMVRQCRELYDNLIDELVGESHDEAHPFKDVALSHDEKAQNAAHMYLRAVCCFLDDQGIVVQFEDRKIVSIEDNQHQNIYHKYKAVLDQIKMEVYNRVLHNYSTSVLKVEVASAITPELIEKSTLHYLRGKHQEVEKMLARASVPDQVSQVGAHLLKIVLYPFYNNAFNRFVIDTSAIQLSNEDNPIDYEMRSVNSLDARQTIVDQLQRIIDPVIHGAPQFLKEKLYSDVYSKNITSNIRRVCKVEKRGLVKRTHQPFTDAMVRSDLQSDDTMFVQALESFLGGQRSGSTGHVNMGSKESTATRLRELDTRIRDFLTNRRVDVELGDIQPMACIRDAVAAVIGFEFDSNWPWNVETFHDAMKSGHPSIPEKFQTDFFNSHGRASDADKDNVLKSFYKKYQETIVKDVGSIVRFMGMCSAAFSADNAWQMYWPSVRENFHLIPEACLREGELRPQDELGIPDDMYQHFQEAVANKGGMTSLKALRQAFDTWESDSTAAQLLFEMHMAARATGKTILLVIFTPDGNEQIKILRPTVQADISKECKETLLRAKDAVQSLGGALDVQPPPLEDSFGELEIVVLIHGKIYLLEESVSSRKRKSANPEEVTSKKLRCSASQTSDISENGIAHMAHDSGVGQTSSDMDNPNRDQNEMQDFTCNESVDGEFDMGNFGFDVSDIEEILNNPSNDGNFTRGREEECVGEGGGGGEPPYSPRPASTGPGMQWGGGGSPPPLPPHMNFGTDQNNMEDFPIDVMVEGDELGGFLEELDQDLNQDNRSPNSTGHDENKVDDIEDDKESKNTMEPEKCETESQEQADGEWMRAFD